MLDFETMYTHYADDVHSYALGLSGSRETAQDITSETFIRAWSRRESIRTETLKAYLFRIARNLFLEGYRKKRRETVLLDTIPDREPSPDKTAHIRMQLERAESLLLTLPEEERSVFLLRIRQGLSYAEIARVTDLSLSAVKVTIHRIRKKLIKAILDMETAI
ncbi:sigma-70 family RNA polymerase sigma factor [bacterium]|nr:sigma-70 family RNA polymerase sigma factor [bacterium]